MKGVTEAMAGEAVAESVVGEEPDPFLRLAHGSTEVYLIRHADALPDAAEVVETGYDRQALSEVGRRQAAALAERMKSIAPAAVYSSPIARARQTAEALAVALGLEVRLEADLREVELGPVGAELEADVTPAERSAALRARLHEIAHIALSMGVWTSIAGTEPSAALRARVTAAVQRVARAHPGQRVALVSHGNAINAYFAALLGLERDYFFPAANTALSVVRLKGQRRLLLCLNDVAHLR